MAEQENTTDDSTGGEGLPAGDGSGTNTGSGSDDGPTEGNGPVADDGSTRSNGPATGDDSATDRGSASGNGWAAGSPPPLPGTPPPLPNIEPPPKPPRWGHFHNFTSLMLIAALVVAGLRAPVAQAWILGMVFLLAFCAIAGHGVTNNVFGVLIDRRNKMTLSRLQMLLWTVVVLSAYVMLVIARILYAPEGAAPIADPLAIEVPAELWELMGIGVASLVGSPLILGSKANKEPKNGTLEKNLSAYAAQLGMKRSDAESQKHTHDGLIDTNENPSEARFADMFRGDEVGNFAYLDLGKVQMLFFTLILLIAYCAQLWVYFANPDTSELMKPEARLPVLSESMLALLAISHAGYLGAKATTHTPVKT